jgi:hypothetical protein
MIIDTFACTDCGHDTQFMHEYYMVNDCVWYAALEIDEATMLCIRCLETRIGRQLRSADFMDAPINWGVFRQSLRLRSRLTSD